MPSWLQELFFGPQPIVFVQQTLGLGWPLPFRVISLLGITFALSRDHRFRIRRTLSGAESPAGMHDASPIRLSAGALHAPPRGRIS